MHINHTSRYTVEKNGNKYLVFDSVDENKEKNKYADVWDEIKTKSKQ